LERHGRALTLTPGLRDVPLPLLFGFMKLGKKVSLKDFSNFRIGGLADDFVEAYNLDELVDSIKTAKEVQLPVFVLGGGTNILWSDDGLVILLSTSCIRKTKRG